MMHDLDEQESSYAGEKMNTYNIVGEDSQRSANFSRYYWRALINIVELLRVKRNVQYLFKSRDLILEEKNPLTETRRQRSIASCI